MKNLELFHQLYPEKLHFEAAGGILRAFEAEEAETCVLLDQVEADILTLSGKNQPKKVKNRIYLKKNTNF
jgi:hypothetical protein